jgi:radical SAM/Cys-rich protein
MTQPSLQRQQSIFADKPYQLQLLNEVIANNDLIHFADRLKTTGLYPLKPTKLSIFQVNVGYMCNQTCSHCHVDAGPDRKEIMTRETMQQCVNALKNAPSITTVDMTGGAPEMNPDFRWFVTECTKLGKKIIVRCNLTIIVANKKYHDLPQFFVDNNVEVVSSLPFYNADRTDRQRGEGVFEDSIKALKMLNAVGYGKPDSGLILNLVYNPSGAFLPSTQDVLQPQFKKALHEEFDIQFNSLFAITNIPIARYLEYLVNTNNYDAYMTKLANAYNPTAAANVMCRNTVSVDWQGYLYDCDFNQMLDLKLKHNNHIAQFDVESLESREIKLAAHCYGCTAGAGSSCGGETAA